MLIPLLGLMLTIAIATAPANAQVVSGRVLGFDGKPAAGAVVELHLEGSESYEVLTDPSGRFARSCEAKVASLRAQHEGVVVAIPFAEGKTTDLEVTFANAAHFTLRGQVLLPNGAPAADTEVLCRDANGKALVSVATDAKGQWSARLGKPARDVVVDPLGLAVVEAGPFARDQVISIDLRAGRGTWFSLQGRVIDATGPCRDEIVRAHLVDSRMIWTRTRADGAYTIWTNGPVARIEVARTFPIRRRGPFAAATTALDLDESEHGLVLFVGRFLTVGGAPIAHAWIFGVDRDAPPRKGIRPDGMTGADGRFRVLLPRNTPFVFAWSEDGEIGGTAAVPADRASIEVRAK